MYANKGKEEERMKVKGREREREGFLVVKVSQLS